MKNLKKKLILTGLMTSGLLLLSGCVQTHVVDGVRVPTEAATHGITYPFRIVYRSGRKLTSNWQLRKEAPYSTGALITSAIISISSSVLFSMECHCPTSITQTSPGRTTVLEPSLSINTPSPLRIQ